MRFTPEAKVTEQLGLPPNTLPSLRRAKKGPRWHKLGTKAFYLQEDVDTWLAACVQDPDADTEEVDGTDEFEEGADNE